MTDKDVWHVRRPRSPSSISEFTGSPTSNVKRFAACGGFDGRFVRVLSRFVRFKLAISREDVRSAWQWCHCQGDESLGNGVSGRPDAREVDESLGAGCEAESWGQSGRLYGDRSHRHHRVFIKFNANLMTR